MESEFRLLEVYQALASDSAASNSASELSPGPARPGKAGLRQAARPSPPHCRHASGAYPGP